MIERGNQDYLLYAFLDEPARGLMLRQAGDDPEAAAAIAESKSLHDRMETGLRLSKAELDDIILAYVAASPSTGMSTDLLHSRILDQEHGAERLEAVQNRVRLLEEGSSAVSHFQAISGHVISGQAISAQVVAGGPRTRGATRGRGRWRRGLGALAVLLALVVAHGAWSLGSEDPLAREAWSQVSDRAGTPRGEPRAEALARARLLVSNARTTTLGLWPRYDRDMLIEAKNLVGQVEEPSAQLDHGRILMVLGDFEQARRVVSEISSEGPSRVERDSLLALLGRASTAN